MKASCGLAAILLIAAASNAENLTRDRDRRSKNEPSPERFNYFDVELLQETTKADPGNVVVSPASIKALLAMILEGSGGRSAEQLRQTLRIEESKNLHRLQLNTFLKSLKVQNDGYTVELGNRVFVSTTTELRREYKETLDKYYYADTRQVDFSSPRTAASTINNWVNEQTHGLIKSLVEPDVLSRYSKLMLANAVYFKGKWKVPFDPDATSVKDFYPEDGVCNKAFYMETLGIYPYAYIQDLNAHALELPYEGNKFSMLLLMPNERKGIQQLLRDLSYGPLHSIIPKLVRTEILVSVPRFKTEYMTDLISSLSNLGIEDIFGPKANLSGMLITGEPNYITNVFHKTKIEVNEEGSIAGAGTGAIAVPLIGRPVPKFHPNRPYLFFIRDIQTGSILFEGRVTSPEITDGTCSDMTSNQQEPVPPHIPINQQPNLQETTEPSLLHPTRPAFGAMKPTPSHQGHNNKSYNKDRDSIQFFNSS